MTTVINLRDIDFSFFEKLKRKFGDKEVSITINEGNETITSQKGIFDELEELQKNILHLLYQKILIYQT